MQVIIDGRFVRDEADLHRRLAGAFGYGPAYRPGLAGLRDRLAAGDPRPVQLTWIHATMIRMALGPEAFAALVSALEAIERADERKSWDERFVLRIFD